MRAIGLAVLVATMLASGCSTKVETAPTENSSAPATSAVDTLRSAALNDLFAVNTPVSQRGACETPSIVVKTPDGTQTFAIAGWDSAQELTLRTGTTVTVVASGNCRRSVHVSAGNARLVARSGTGPGRYVFHAVQAGRVTLTASIGMCAQPRGFDPVCRGGVDRLLALGIEVRA